MSNPPIDSTEFVGSHEKAENGYGQNGYQGPSSDLPGQHTSSGFLPQTTVPKSDWQTRDVSKEQYPAAHGMKAAAPPAAFPTATVRRAVARQPGNRSFQR